MSVSQEPRLLYTLLVGQNDKTGHSLDRTRVLKVIDRVVDALADRFGVTSIPVIDAVGRTLDYGREDSVLLVIITSLAWEREADQFLGDQAEVIAQGLDQEEVWVVAHPLGP